MLWPLCNTGEAAGSVCQKVVLRPCSIYVDSICRNCFVYGQKFALYGILKVLNIQRNVRCTAYSRLLQ